MPLQGREPSSILGGPTQLKVRFILVEVNKQQCERIGKIIKNLKFRSSFYQEEFLTLNTDSETKMRAYIYSVAICHQTHTLVNKKKNLIGWDYLKYVFTNLMRDNSELLEPNYLASLSVNELSKKLKSLFADDGNPENCTLDRLDERSKFIIDISRVLKEKYECKLTKLIESSDDFLVNNGKGIYELLEDFESYTDPMRKKSTVFVKLLIESGLLEIRDPENIIPIMDYHMQRVLMRMGCVEILDENLKKKLINKETLKSDEEIRSASIKSMRLISKISGHPILKMNDFFYTLGRSCCKEKILCVDGECNKNPCTFNLAVDLDSHKKCVFEGVCKGSLDEEYCNLWQPIVETHYY